VKIHTTFITFNRLELTKQAIASYLETVILPYSYNIVDNGSSDGTMEWLMHHGFPCIFLGENRYPGYACNRGWEARPEDATHLHRADNDFRFLPGWCREVERMFHDEKLGQLGLRTNEQEMFEPNNVGGNCVLRRSLWDEGLRYDERPWSEYPAGWSEDGLMSPAVRVMGYRWKRAKRLCIEPLASGNWDDEYYQKSFGDRGIQRPD
jgi:hypothetical protein